MKIIKYEDFEITNFEDEDELITLVIDSKYTFWTTPKNLRFQKEQYKLWEESPEYRKLEYELWFGKQNESGN